MDAERGFESRPGSSLKRRLVSEHFKRSGLPKRGLTRSEAIEEAQRTQMRAYKCTFCGKWHVGSIK